MIMDLKEKLRSLPTDSGVYLMKDIKGQIIYVGKAKSLKNRVNQYFQNSPKPPKTKNLVKNIADFDIIVCSSELDALCLEARLIKKHRPFYNVLLKDGRGYPYIRLDVNEPFGVPRVVYKVENDGAKYYGPFMLGVSPYDIIDVIKYAFGTRFCDKKLRGKSKRGCLYCDMKLCSGVCTGNISQEDYKIRLESAEKFLKGDTALIKKILEAKMYQYANDEKFEIAIKYRNQLKSVERLEHRYTVELDNFEDADIIGIYTEGYSTGIAILIYRNGMLYGKDSYITEFQDSDSLLNYLGQYYADKLIPKNIYLSHNFVDSELLGGLLTDLAKRKIEIKIPQKAIHKKLTDLAVKNSREFLEKNLTTEKLLHERTIGAVLNLQKKLGLKNTPYRIEGYDISNINGVDKVASMVVFTNGEPNKAHYRKFKIKNVEGANDFASLQETLQRRLDNLTDKDESFSSVPNLILIDGGKGQLNAVADIITQKGIEVISIAKKEEIVFTQYSNEPVIIDRSDYTLQLLQRIRDESHRFAITFFRNLHNKNNLKMSLDEIKGIGKEKKKAIIEHFSNIADVKKASVEELCKIKGISKTLAQNIYDYYHKN